STRGVDAAVHLANDLRVRPFADELEELALLVERRAVVRAGARPRPPAVGVVEHRAAMRAVVIEGNDAVEAAAEGDVTAERQSGLILGVFRHAHQVDRDAAFGLARETADCREAATISDRGKNRRSDEGGIDDAVDSGWNKAADLARRIVATRHDSFSTKLLE